MNATGTKLMDGRPVRGRAPKSRGVTVYRQWSLAAAAATTTAVAASAYTTITTVRIGNDVRCTGTAVIVRQSVSWYRSCRRRCHRYRVEERQPRPAARRDTPNLWLAGAGGGVFSGRIVYRTRSDCRAVHTHARAHDSDIIIIIIARRAQYTTSTIIR